jgi:radical SAM protein with 4Fe4S-binding SPASM domain
LQGKKYLKLADRVLLRKFEVSIVYKAKTDELYELDDEGFQFLKDINRIDRSFDKQERDFIDYCIQEGIVELSEKSEEISWTEGFRPSLRHLLLHTTYRCNLRCRHCYLEKKSRDMDYGVFELLLDEFNSAGGLKVMLSGGEPLLHPEIDRMIALTNQYDFRKVLITNGTLINEKNCNIEVDEVQISIDGLESHDLIRSEGSFEKAIKAVELLRGSGVDVSIATMVHSLNADEFEKMEKIFKELGVKSWMVDYPSVEGEMKSNTHLLLPPEKAARIMRNYGFFDSGHRSHGDYACGAHMCSSDPDGNISRCGFFEPVGNIREGLDECWKRLNLTHLWKLEEIEGCRDCEIKESCKGGCRFRAANFNSLNAPDPVMCAVYGKLYGKP